MDVLQIVIHLFVQMIALMAATVVANFFPQAYLVDVSKWPGQFDAKFDVTLEAADGSELFIPVTFLSKDATPIAFQAFFLSAVKSHGWRGQAELGGGVIVLGSAKFPVKAVTWESGQWHPPIEVVRVLPGNSR